MKLYEIPQEYEQLIELYYKSFDDETGELLTTEKELEEIQNKIKELENRANE